MFEVVLGAQVDSMVNLVTVVLEVEVVLPLLGKHQSLAVVLH